MSLAFIIKLLDEEQVVRFISTSYLREKKV